MIRAFEWTASTFVVLGVFLIARFIDVSGLGHTIGFAVGVVLLTFGVRLAIDVARVRENT